jgi:hypothetical protein
MKERRKSMATNYKNDEYVQMPYDLVKELTIGIAAVGVIVLLLSIFLSTPDVPALTAKKVDSSAPMLIVQTALQDLSQQDAISTYGPPYNAGLDNIQKVGRFAPQSWSGVSIPVQSAKDEVIQPLSRITNLVPSLVQPLYQWNHAGSKQQTAWVTAVQNVLNKSKIGHNQLQLPNAQNTIYGPVPALLNGYLQLSQTGLLESAIDGTGPMPLTNRTKSLLLLQDENLADGQYATKLGLTGDQWGIMKETGNYPGAVWLWYYTLLYHIPPYNNSDATDLLVVMTVAVMTLLLMFIPFIPGLRSIPRWIKIYRLIWRDFYKEQTKKTEESYESKS